MLDWKLCERPMYRTVSPTTPSARPTASDVVVHGCEALAIDADCSHIPSSFIGNTINQGAVSFQIVRPRSGGAMGPWDGASTEVAVAFGARHARLGERRDVERPVQLAVSTAAEAMALDLPARHLKRRRPRVAGVVRARGEATDRSRGTAKPHAAHRYS